MTKRRFVIAGGGPAGFFAAITCAEAAPDVAVVVLEKGPQFLAKVRISGGGRCNVTHACFDPRDLSASYPRGGSALIGPFHHFQPRDTIEWFANRGVVLKTEADGRMFPVTDSSVTIVNSLLDAAGAAGVQLRLNCGLEEVRARPGGGFELVLPHGENLVCDRLMLATGGCRTPGAERIPASLGHSLEPPVPSLFSFQTTAPWVRALAGVSVPSVEVSVPGAGLCERGPLLFTHSGLSGPAILRLSAWGARALHGLNYRFQLRMNWLPGLTDESLADQFEACRRLNSARLIVNAPAAPLPSRLWENLLVVSGIPRETRWADLSRSGRHQLLQQLLRTDVDVSGKTTNREEFVTCGGVRLREVNFQTMESRKCPGLHFGGELLDLDGLTGGFNFQAAWTTGWLAGLAMAGQSPVRPQRRSSVV